MPVGIPSVLIYTEMHGQASSRSMGLGTVGRDHPKASKQHGR